MTDKLPEWPKPTDFEYIVKVDHNGMHLPLCDYREHLDAEYRKVLVAFWESRCRLAVEALKDMSNAYPGSDTYDMCDAALSAIGPLPERES